MVQDSYASMDPRMRVGTILREPLVIQRQGSRGDQQRRVTTILGEVGLPAAAADRYPPLPSRPITRPATSPSASPSQAWFPRPAVIPSAAAPETSGPMAVAHTPGWRNQTMRTS